MPQQDESDSVKLAARVRFDDVVADFISSLETKMRSFRPTEDLEWLDLWVHDEDPLHSLKSLTEAAQAHGYPAVTIEIGSEWIGRIEREAVETVLSELGTIASSASEDSLEITVTFPEGGAASTVRSPRSIPRRAASVRPTSTVASPTVQREATGEAYQAAVTSALEDLQHQGPAPAPRDDENLVEATSGPLRFSVTVNAQHRVVAATHEGSSDDLTRAACETLCGLIEGWPIQEVSDHGPLRVLQSLRDPQASRPVPGVVAPKNVHPAFDTINEIVRQAFQSYVEATGFQPIENHFDPGPAESWRSLEDSERMGRVQAELDRLCPILGLPPSICQEAVDDGGVSLSFEESIPSRQGGLLMRLELELHQTLDAAIHLRVEEMADGNRIRRAV